jgi:toxin-antitoxin system PIN domain toxin
MRSLDTNLLFAGCNARAEGHTTARNLLLDWGKSDDVLLCEGVLVELYNLLRNQAVMSGKALSPASAVEVVQSFRHHPKWRLVETAPVMNQVWESARTSRFPRRRIFDARIAYTLLHHRVRFFATANVKDFRMFGFEEVWNPLA